MVRVLAQPVTLLGAFFLRRIIGLGAFLIFLRQALAEVCRRPLRLDRIFIQLEFIGIKSLLIIVITGFFVGAVFGLQVGSIFSIFSAESLTGSATGLALTRELAPLITAFLIAGRAGSAITAELAAMKVNEQIDAMEAMGVNPLSYLVKPLLIASTVMMPLLCIFFILLGMIGSYVSALFIFDVSEGIFREKVLEFIVMQDVIAGLVKAVFFGLVIATVACNCGLHARGGARGIGEATTTGVVTNLLSVLCLDVLITWIQVST